MPDGLDQALCLLRLLVLLPAESSVMADGRLAKIDVRVDQLQLVVQCFRQRREKLYDKLAKRKVVVGKQTGAPLIRAHRAHDWARQSHRTGRATGR